MRTHGSVYYDWSMLHKCVLKVGLIFCVLVLTGCATPKPIKEAVGEIDKGYDQNLKLMNQYKQIAVNINKRYEFWAFYIGQRQLLDLSLRAILEDIEDDEVEIILKLLGADPNNEVYDSELIKLVNELRVEGLRAEMLLVPSTGANKEVFKAGQPNNNTGEVVRRMPEIVGACSRQAPKTFDINAAREALGMNVFDTYHKNVAYLKEINRHIKNYLDIDITVKPEDVAEISKSIRQLQQ